MSKPGAFLWGLVIVAFLCAPLSAVEESEAFCYVSLVEGDAFVRQAGSPQLKPALINFPLLPGDALETGNNGRCEIQFDNGTVMRLDKETRLQIDTLRAASLTTDRRITTLELASGRLFSMNNIFGRELFQVVTPQAAFKLSRESTATLAVDDAGSRVHVARGEIGVLYGEPASRLKKVHLHKGEGALISTAHTLAPGESRIDSEFQLWNKYVNNHFKELHHGISRLPRPIYRFPPGVVRFAEKWSSLYGEWEYNDLLGYIWKPYDESFKYPDRRPFFHARYVTVNDQLYVVPTQPWGWIPAHMGTWVWMKKNGWVWIPGTAFKPGMYGADWLWNQMKGDGAHLFAIGMMGSWGGSMWPDFFRLGVSPGYGPSGCWTLSDWIRYVYGDYEGYAIYRRYGQEGWRAHYDPSGRSRLTPPPVVRKSVPKEVAVVLERMDKTPLPLLDKQFNMGKNGVPATGRPVAPARKVAAWLVYRSLLTAGENVDKPEEKKITGGRLVKGPVEKRDWNPDRVIAHRLGTDLAYSSDLNAVLLPELKVSSGTITARQKFQLRTMAIRKARPMNKPALTRNFSGGPVGGSVAAGNNDPATPAVSSQPAPADSSKSDKASARK